MSAETHLQLPASVRLVYGFHDPEQGFVWSAHAFGLLFAADRHGSMSLFLDVFNPHAEVGLSYCIDGRLFDTRVPHGAQRIVIDEECLGRFVDFEITPKVLLASDVRELGLMFRRIAWDSPKEQGCRFRLLSAPHRLLGAAQPDALSRLRLAARTMGSRVVGGFLREGWFKGGWVGGALRMQLHVPLWSRTGTALTCACTVNGRGETVVFRRDERRPNVYHATLPVSAIVHRTEAILDIREPIDIELSPNAIGRYRGQGIYWRGRGTGGFPDLVNIERVAGAVSVENFLLHGASWLVKLDRLSNLLLPGGLSESRRIVDWGCGCGRITRHFPEELRARVIGFDVDPVNIEWCRENLSDMRFEHCRADPPLDLESGSVDVLFAHSVLTHLGEERQCRWLAEISRVLRPGGVAFLTVLAELSWYDRFYPAGRTPEVIAEYLQKGFVDHGWQQDFGVDVDCPGTYVQVSHGFDYVYSVWSRMFQIVDWIDGFADLQTLVIVRKPE